MSNSTNNPVNNPINDPMNHPPAHRRIILALPSLLLGLGLCACGSNNSAPARSDAALDQSAPPTPDAGASPRDIGTPGLDSGLLSGDGAPGASETGVATLDDAPGSSDTATAPLDGTLGSSDAGAPTLDGEAAPPAVRGMVAVNSDYQSTAVSLLDPDGNVVKDGCINSGTGKPGLTMTLSGDVVLPSQLLTTSPITLIDRGNNVLIWIDPTTCAPLRELDVSTGFTADPHDYVELAPNKAYVTRYEQNTAAKATDTNFDQGNDLLIVDPSQPKILGRIDLGAFAPAGVLPRADRALLVSGQVFVTLDASNTDYQGNATGRLVIVDPASDQVVGTVDLPGTKNCSAMFYLAADHKLLVACNGDYGDGAQQYAASGIATLDISTSPPALVTLVTGAAASNLVFSNSTVAALDASSVLGVTDGALSGTPPDSLWLIPQDGTSPSKIFSSAEAFALGAVLVDAQRNLVFVADGTTVAPPLLRVFTRSGGAFVATTTITTNPTQKLPPRALAWF
jgi:hypothetical protein